LIQAYGKIARELKQGGVKVLGGTIAPFAGSSYGSAEREKTRVRVNQWIRANFDGVVDFDAAVKDPQKTDRMAKRFDSGDHLHLNPAGYQAMADVLKLDLLNK
jgi:lysophospholipase L1-like esterase